MFGSWEKGFTQNKNGIMIEGKEKPVRRKHIFITHCFPTFL